MIRAVFIGILLFLSCCISTLQAGQTQGTPKPVTSKAISISEMELLRTAKSPKIDGRLDDPAWQGVPLPASDWVSYNPLYGNRMAQHTTVWATYDDTGLYFAFHCTDPEPEKIKTAISRRDTIFNDDWVGLSLDALGSHQSSYEFFVNPSGIQADILNSSTAGEDTSPDWVWESAAQRTDDGYDVEIHIPYKTIRFKSGKDVRMEVLFWRRVSRLGMSASWPDLPPGTSIFTRHAPLLLHDVKRPLTLELIPNLTYAMTQSRTGPNRWSTNSDPDGGITGKYGISSTVTLDGTYRPDFSQVESDAFQVEVNQRYPIFYSEKRPFFMEGMGTFELAGSGGDANMQTAVHTRRIIDPVFGVKLTGTVGKVTFAGLSSSDRSPGNSESADPSFDQREYFNIGRALYSLGKGTYIGGLVTDTELGSGYNRVAAGDISLQFGEHQQVNATAITSTSRDLDGSNTRDGMAGQATYSYSSKKQVFISQFEHYDKDFQMDTAFYNRTGITSNWTYYCRNFYPDEKRYGWFKKIAPFIWIHHDRDRIQGGNERFVLGGMRFNFTRQGSFRIDYGRGKEAWAGRQFDIRQIQLMGGAQILRWLNFFSYVNFSRSIYYDPQEPFSGTSRHLHIDCKIQPTPKLSQTMSYDHVLFNRAPDGRRIYTVDVINAKTTYQFNKHLSVRAIERYDSSRKNVLMDYLMSYEPVPGTVAYAGYGTLMDKQNWDGTQFVRDNSRFLNTQRSLFFKLSYLYRF